nr:sphingomyelin phosphodiesterase-like [Biomphalaria glabrata]
MFNFNDFMMERSILIPLTCLGCFWCVISAVPVVYAPNRLTFLEEHHSINPIHYTQELREGDKSLQDKDHYLYSSTNKQTIILYEKNLLMFLRKLFSYGQGTLKASRITCHFCELVASQIHNMIANNASWDDIKLVVGESCKLLKQETPRVCDGLVEEFAPEVLTVLANTNFSSEELCSFLLGPECAGPDVPTYHWNVTFPPVPQPPPVYPTPPKPGSPRFKFLHLTDIHFDAEYKEGSTADCNEPLCCRDDSNTQDYKKAGKFGDYRKCDMPLWSLENMFSVLAAQSDSFDYIIWTGDLPPHNVWNQSRTDQVTTLKTIVGLFHKYFPNKPVFPSLGNHESSPVNSFPPPYVTNNESISWLYDALADQWKQWLPTGALETVRWGAYYVTSPFPGLRIISLNMNYCNNQNWWMLLNSTDPADELQWLISVLQAAENDGVKVHILGHIPPGIDDCLKIWSWNYYNIISRYQNTIAGQFFGHTHFDSFSVFYDIETLKIPISVAYVAPSVTPYTDLNMGYRIYTVDGNYQGSSFQVLDHETYFMNLSRANEEGKMTWELEYSAKEAYNMSSVYPKDWDELIKIMSVNNTVLEQYNKYYTKSRNSGKCDKTCRTLRLCEMRSGRSHDPSLCSNLGLKDEGDLKHLLSQQPKHC